MTRDVDTHDGIKAAIEALVPKSLDDIIRKNRDRAQIYLSTPGELAALAAPGLIVDRQASIKGVLREWSFVTLKVGRVPGVILMGHNVTVGQSWGTSVVAGIADDLVRTRSGSLYRVDGPSTDQPDLLHLCAMLWTWGVGESLGVPHIFY
jgi:hypothetical protein